MTGRTDLFGTLKTSLLSLLVFLLLHRRKSSLRHLEPFKTISRFREKNEVAWSSLRRRSQPSKDMGDQIRRISADWATVLFAQCFLITEVDQILGHFFPL
jgi:hypothetical protein